MLGELGCGPDEGLVGVRRKSFGIVGDESALYPISTAGFDIQVKQTFFGVGDELFGVSRAGPGLSVHDISASPTLSKKNRPSHNWRP